MHVKATLQWWCIQKGQLCNTQISRRPLAHIGSNRIYNAVATSLNIRPHLNEVITRDLKVQQLMRIGSPIEWHQQNEGNNQSTRSIQSSIEVAPLINQIDKWGKH